MATLAEVIAQACGEATAKAIHDAKGDLHDIAVAGGDAASNGLLGDVSDVVGILSNLIGDIPVIGGILQDVTNPVAAVEKAGGRFGRGFGLGYVLGYVGWQLFQPIMLPVIHAVNAHTTNEIYDPATAATLTAKGIVRSEAGAGEAAGGGFDTPHFEGMVEGARSYPAVGELLAAWNRAELTDTQVDTALERAGIPDGYWTAIKSLHRVMLSPADLALAVLRGNIDTVTMEGYARQLGVTADDMAVLVENTGEPPGLMQLLEAYRREFIPQDRLVRGIRQSRIRNEWTDVVEKLRYSPMPIADAINAAVRNIIPVEQARSIAQQNGLEPGDFDALLAAHGRPISDGQALELLNRGEMNADQVRQVVRESDVKDKYVDDVLKLARRLIPYRTINTILTHGIRPPEWGIQYLMQLGYTHDDADALVSTATSAKTSTLKQITEAQVLDLYEAKDITRPQADELLHNIGYAKPEAAYIMDAVDAKATMAEQNKAINAVRAAYLADRITISDARNQLDALDVLAGRRDILIRDWQVERKGIIRVPSEGQWASAVYYGVVTFEYAEKRLRALGYSDDDARLLLDIRLHGIQPGTPPPTGAPPSHTP